MIKGKLNESVLQEHREVVHEFISRHFLLRTLQSFENLTSLLRACRSENERFIEKLRVLVDKGEKIRIIHEHVVYRKAILGQLNLWIKECEKSRIFEDYAVYHNEIETWLRSRPEKWISFQTPERFQRLLSDSISVRCIKFIKRKGYSIFSFPFILSNRFRKLRGKAAMPLPLWVQQIPVKKLTRWYYGNAFLQAHALLMDQSMKSTALLAKELWDVDHFFFESFNEFANEKAIDKSIIAVWEQKLNAAFSELEQKIEKQRIGIKNQFYFLLADIDKQFDKQLDIAGTLEFSGFQHGERRRKWGVKKLLRTYCTTVNQRNSTLFALADDWKFNQEIYILKGNALKANFSFQNKIVSRAETLSKALTKVPLFLQETQAEIRELPYDEFRKNLVQIKLNAAKRLNGQIIPDIQDVLLEQGFPLVIDEAEQNMINELSVMQSARVLIDGFDPSKAYNNRQLKSVIPFELIDFEMMAQVKQVLLSTKILTVEKLEELKNELENLGRMVVFNLDSSIALLDEQGDLVLDASQKDARSSMERAIGNYNQLKTLFDDFILGLQSEIEGATRQFNEKITHLTDNSRVADISYRIARAKALNRSKLLVSQTRDFANKLYSTSTARYRSTRKQIESGLDVLRAQLGIRFVSDEISVEISEFLVSGEQNVLQLPFVYRRLFVNEPLKETTFYLGRISEQKQLEIAYEKWKKGSFTPVLIFGEKGSGISTFVQLFVKEKIKHSPVVYSVLPSKRILSEEDLLALLGNSIRGEAFLKLAELYEYLEKNEPFVVFVDKLHMLYLRQPGGFSILKKFFEIVSNTSRKIFWICTCGLYASEYLNKSVGLYDYFPILISMNNLTNAEVRKLIMLRHKTSGYDLYFKPSRKDKVDKSFQRKNESQQQEYLREKYFTILNKETRSNVAFALKLWLWSAEKPDGNRIFLNSLENLDFSFMFNLPHEVVFGLHALLLHERLDVFQLSQVLSISRRQAYLLLMRLADRGIISEDKGIYSIHTLLYRQTITLLKDKNLIH
jgi:hypothetical protein